MIDNAIGRLSLAQAATNMINIATMHYQQNNCLDESQVTLLLT